MGSPQLWSRLKKQSSVYKRLRPYQRNAVDQVLEMETAAVFAEQRTGKTWITAAVLDVLYQEDDFCALVFCVMTNKHTSWVATLVNEIPDLAISTTFEEYKAKGRKGLLLLHYDQLRDKRLISKLRRVRWKIIVADESQRLKDRGSLTSRRLKQLRNHAQFKMILTGTPVEQKPEDMWGQFRFLNPEILGDTWAPFKEEYLYGTGYMGLKLKFRMAKFKQFMAEIDPYCIRIDQEDAGILPPQVKVVDVKLSPYTRRFYNLLEDSVVTELSGQTITADMAMTMMMKLHQTCGGYVKTDDGEVLHVGGAKQRVALSLVRRLAGPCVIFCRFLPEIAGLVSSLDKRGYSVAALTGKVKDTKRAKPRTEMLQAFQRGEIDVLVCQIKTGGVGIDLYRAAFAIIYSTTYSWIDLDQANKRLCHLDRKDNPRVFFLRTRGTMEEAQYEAFEEKTDMVEKIMTRLKKR